MDHVSLYWTIVVGVVGTLWTLITFYRERAANAVECAKNLTSRLLEDDKLIIENPDIQFFLSNNATKPVKFFRNKKLLKSLSFFKAKAAVYKQINLFDEILSTSSKTSRRLSIFKPPSLIEYSDWETYIIVKMRHPLFLSIMENEKDIFGEAIRKFWEINKIKIQESPADPFVW